MSERINGLCQQIVYKNEEWARYMKAVVESCANAWLTGQRDFAADDVPEELHPPSPRMPGNVWSALVRSGILEPVRIGEGQVKRRRSSMKSRKGAWINVYRLVSFERAATWLELHHGIEIKPQMEMAI